MPTATATPPPAPSKEAPSPTPTPAQIGSEAQPTERPTEEWMGGIEGELADLDAGKPLPGQRERTEDGKFKPAVKPKVKPKEEEQPPEELQGEQPKETPPPEKIEETPKPGKAAEIRTAYESLKNKVQKELQPEIQKLRTKVAELESKTATDPAPLLEKIGGLEKRNAELQKKIAVMDYMEDPDFKKNFIDPYERAWADAVEDFKELLVIVPGETDEFGDRKNTTRPATPDDLLKLSTMGLSAMDAAAQEMFGPSYARAINHIQKIKELRKAQEKGRSEAERKALEAKEGAQLQWQKQAKEIADTWVNANKNLQEKYPKAFKPDETDPEDKAAHTKGFAFADLMFLGSANLQPEQIEALPKFLQETVRSGKPLSEQQKTQMHALARVKMANHDRKVAALKKAVARIAELEKSLSEYESSEPTAAKAGESPRASGKAWDQVVEDELRALDKG
jgi:hypothetical protein